MGVLGYTAIYQMVYLLLETAEGKLTNQTVNDTLQAFLADTDNAIQEQDWSDLEAFRNSVLEYYEATVENEAGIETVLQYLKQTLEAFHIEAPALLTLVQDTLKELL